MDKKILSTAIAGVLAGSMAFAANADVTLYGKVNVSIDSVDCDTGWTSCARGGLTTTKGDDVVMNSRSGFGAIGVKGSEDLGNGLQAIFQLEYGTNPAEAGTFSGRDQWLGMKGGFGMIRAGSMSTNYKESGSKLDPFWRTSLDSRDAMRASQLHSGNGQNGQGRATNTLRFDSADFNGAKIVANYSFDNGSNAVVEDNDAYGIGLHYANGPILATVDYITNDNGGDDDAWKIGGKYNFGDFAAFGSYERGGLLFADLNAGSAGNGADGATVWQLGGSFTMGNAMLFAAYGQGDRDLGAANDEHESWTIAGNYSFSKRTSMYAGFEQVDRDTWGERDLFTVGMVHNF